MQVHFIHIIIYKYLYINLYCINSSTLFSFHLLLWVHIYHIFIHSRARQYFHTQISFISLVCSRVILQVDYLDIRQAIHTIVPLVPPSNIAFKFGKILCRCEYLKIGSTIMLCDFY